jgi:hypothetical protein
LRYSEPWEQQKIAEILHRRTPLASEQRWLMCTLSVFFVVTLVFILVPAIVGLVHVDWLKTWMWTPWLIYVASALLAITSTYVVLTAARSSRGMLTLVLLLALASPALAGAVRCQTYEQKTMNQRYTVCDDGTRATSTWSPTWQQWTTTVTPPPGQTCTGRLNPVTRQWEGRCR